MTNATAALRLEGLTHAFGPTEVLSDIHLTLRAGEAVALLGPSGGGKTTLLHLAAGLLTPQQGRVQRGFTRCAVMFQQPRLLPWQRTLDNIALGLRAAGHARAQAREAAAQMGRRVGLDEAALQAWPHQLSGGMQSRAALARALVLSPELLLMDEPFAALDIGLKAQLQQLLQAETARHGSALLMITHDPAEALRLADRVLVLAGRPGRIVHEQRLSVAPAARSAAQVLQLSAELLQVPAVRQAFELPDEPGAVGQPCPESPSPLVGEGLGRGPSRLGRGPATAPALTPGPSPKVGEGSKTPKTLRCEGPTC